MIFFVCQRKIFFWLWLVSAGGGLAVMVFAFTGAFSSTCLFCKPSEMITVL